eukprot:scaffold10354_cov157-Skeletonema_dohrnii-CCMP3373.AAC.3
MQNVTGNVAPITQRDQEAITTDGETSMNYDVASPTANSTITSSPKASTLSDENGSVDNNSDDGADQ